MTTENIHQVAVLTTAGISDFEPFLDRCVALGVGYLDLSAGIYGKRVMDLTDAEAKRTRKAMKARGIQAWCLTPGLFDASIDTDEADFRANEIGRLPRALELASVFKPVFVALGAVTSEARSNYEDFNDYLTEEAPWVYDAYADAIGMVADANLTAAITNKVESALTRPDEILGFFDTLAAGDRAVLNWDALDTVRSGCSPSPDMLRALSPVLGYARVQGGRGAAPGGLPVYRARLAESDWGTRVFIDALKASTLSPVVCLRPTQGAPSPHFADDEALDDDVRWLKAHLEAE